MDIQRIRDKFKDDRFAVDVTGIKIETADRGFSRCTLQIENKHLNAADNLMGGVTFTLADFAFAVAANNSGDSLTVSLSSQISFLGRPKTQKLVAEAAMIKEGGKTCFYSVDIRDDQKTPVASVAITGYKIGSGTGLMNNNK